MGMVQVEMDKVRLSAVIKVGFAKWGLSFVLRRAAKTQGHGDSKIGRVAFLI